MVSGPPTIATASALMPTTDMITDRDRHARC